MTAGLIGATKRELIGQRLLKPCASGGGPIEHSGVGDLKLSERERMPVPAPAVLVGQRRGQRALPALEEPADILSRQAVADPGERLRVIARGEPVIQRPEGDALLGGLLLGPLVPVEIDPHRERRIGDGLQKTGSPIGVADVEVVVVREDRLAAIHEMRMPVRPAITPPAPHRGLLLRDPDHHDAVAILLLGAFEMLASDLLLHIPLDEADRRNLVGGYVVVDLVDVVTADLAQHRRRRDRESAIQQKPDHLPLGHQPRHLPLQEQAVHGPDLQAHVISE